MNLKMTMPQSLANFRRDAGAWGTYPGKTRQAQYSKLPLRCKIARLVFVCTYHETGGHDERI